MIDRARQLADEVLFPNAQRVDRTEIPSSHLGALADAGLFSITHLPPREARRVVAALGGGCGATFFVWVQHHGVLHTLMSSDNAPLVERFEHRFRSGELVAGTAFAHVRRRGTPAVTASRCDGGWTLTGVAPWGTSWGIAEWFSVAAETDDGRIHWSLVPGHDGDGLTAIPLDLPVFASTGTVALEFRRYFVADEYVIAVESAERWRDHDRRRAAIGQPAVLGVAERAIGLLAGSARDTTDEAHATAARLATELERRWAHDDELTDRFLDGQDAIAAASEHRAACLHFGQRATTALLAAVGGRGMDLTHPAQRLAREATFYVIQAQTSDGRAATLRSV